MADSSRPYYLPPSGSQQLSITGSVADISTVIPANRNVRTADQTGKYINATAWGGGQASGKWGAILVSGSVYANWDPTAKITVEGGTDIQIKNFHSDTGRILEIGVTSISGSAATPGGGVYLFEANKNWILG